MGTRDHWQKLTRKPNDPAAWSGYKNFKREVKLELRLAQKNFVEKQIRENGNDTSAWKTFRACIPKKSASMRSYNEDDKTVANKFNRFFTSVGKVTVDKITSLASECNYVQVPPTVVSAFPAPEQFVFDSVKTKEV